MIPPAWIDQAVSRLADQILATPLTYDPDYQFILKWENQQQTGSFKIRGALNKVLCLQDWEVKQGLVTASAGNHGQGVALAARQAGAKAIIYASDHAVQTKLAAMQALGAEIRLVPGGYAQAEKIALQYASDNGAIWISPYNDGQVIAGQATLAIEVNSQLRQINAPPPRVWIVPAGGGGLVAGIGAALRKEKIQTRLAAVQSEASPFLHALFTKGSQSDVTEVESLADGLAGAVEEGSITIPLARSMVDRFVLVSEDEIAKAIVFAWQRYQQVIEGSAATALAAAIFHHITLRPAVIILTGGNIQPEVHARLCARPLKQDLA